MNIYLESGYLNIHKILSLKLPFIFIVGGRGTGKTYGALEEVVEEKIKFMYLRRTQSQADLINKPEFSPFKSLNEDHDWKVGTGSLSKYNNAFYMQTLQDGAYVNSGQPIGYTGALSTLSNMRGFDASDVTLFIYDEFIPESHERPIKDEGSALLNAYETINRNRELKGKPPLQLLCLSNANNLANPIFMELGLVRTAEQMKRKGQEVYMNREKGILIINMEKSEISAKKSNTALYRLTQGSEFNKMSVGNQFSKEEIGRIASRPLKEYRPIVNIGEITIYEHKSNNMLYVTSHKVGNPVSFTMGEMDKTRFRKSYCWIWDLYLDDRIEFEEYLSEILLTRAFK